MPPTRGFRLPAGYDDAAAADSVGSRGPILRQLAEQLLPQHGTAGQKRRETARCSVIGGETARHLPLVPDLPTDSLPATSAPSAIKLAAVPDLR